MDLNFHALSFITLLAYPGRNEVKTETFVVTIPGQGWHTYQGRWVDVHVSQSPPRDEEGKLFDVFERGLSFAPSKAQPAPR
jgi:hypothetical protein